MARLSTDTMLDRLRRRALCRLVSKYICPPSEHNSDEQLRSTVRYAYENGLDPDARGYTIPEWAIREEYEDDRDALLEAANSNLRANAFEYAKVVAALQAEKQELKAKNEELKALLTLAGSQWLG